MTTADRKSIFWQQHRHQKVPIITAGLVLMGIGMAAVRYVMDGYLSSLVLVLISTTVACLFSYILYQTRYRAYAVHLFLMAGIISILGTGGFESHGIAWLPLIPLIAALLANNRSAILYTILILVGLSFFGLESQPLQYRHFSLALSIIFACVFAVFLERARIKYERTIIELATSNPITELPSRAVFDVLLDRATELFGNDEVPFVLLFIDVNDLKFVNDNFGHPVGDELLKEIGRRLSEKVKSSETLFHISGDEFAIVAAHTPDLETIKARIRGIGGDFVYHDFLIPLSISVGATFGSADSKTTLVAADDDMYIDKRLHHKSRR